MWRFRAHVNDTVSVTTCERWKKRGDDLLTHPDAPQAPPSLRTTDLARSSAESSSSFVSSRATRAMTVSFLVTVAPVDTESRDGSRSLVVARGMRNGKTWNGKTQTTTSSIGSSNRADAPSIERALTACCMRITRSTRCHRFWTAALRAAPAAAAPPLCAPPPRAPAPPARPPLGPSSPAAAAAAAAALSRSRAAARRWSSALTWIGSYSEWVTGEILMHHVSILPGSTWRGRAAPSCAAAWRPSPGGARRCRTRAQPAPPRHTQVVASHALLRSGSEDHVPSVWVGRSRSFCMGRKIHVLRATHCHLYFAILIHMI